MRLLSLVTIGYIFSST